MAVIETNMWRAYKPFYAPYYNLDYTVDNFKFSILAKEQPKYVCLDCANEYSYWRAVGHGINKGLLQNLDKSHNGTCECCGQTDFDVYDIKNFGFFYEGWQTRKLRFL